MAERAMTDEVEVRCGIGAGALLVLTAALVTTRPPTVDGVALFLAATVLLAHVLDAPRALLLGLTGWALATGFVVNTAGTLTLAPLDTLRLAVFLLAAAGVATERRRT
jgi:hypothetical protein